MANDGPPVNDAGTVTAQPVANAHRDAAELGTDSLARIVMRDPSPP